MFNGFRTYGTMDEAYPKLIMDVEMSGKRFAPRGQECIEVRPVMFVLEQPKRALYSGEERRLNYRFFAIETLCYLSGIHNPDYAKLLCAVNPNIQQFINTTTGMFDGMYGPRLAHGLDHACEVLKRDIWSRQAVASIWNNVEDRNTKDLPCTLSMQFYCTYNENTIHEPHGPTPILNLMTTMRSNDLNWGLPYDVGAFCEILVCMASVLNLSIGTYTHSVGSLHYYIDTPPKVRPAIWIRTIGGQEGEPPAFLDEHPMFEARLAEGEKWSHIAQQAQNLLSAICIYNNNSKWAWTDLDAFDSWFYRHTKSPWHERMIQLLRWNWKRDFERDRFVHADSGRFA